MTVRRNEAGVPVPVGFSEPATKWVKVTKADADLPDGVCRSLWVGTAGTANLRTAEGDDAADFPLLQGPNPFSCKQVQTGGDADDIWAVY